MIFSERLKELREKKSVTQQDLADYLGVGRPTVAGYETKDKQPDYDKLKQIAEYFKVSVDYLLGITDICDPYYLNDTQQQHKKACRSLDVSDLPEEAVKQVEEYIELLRLKYNPNEILKK